MLAHLRRFFIALQIHTDFGIAWPDAQGMADRRIAWRQAHHG